VEVHGFGQPLKATTEKDTSSTWIHNLNPLRNKPNRLRAPPPPSLASPAALLGPKRAYLVEEDFLDLNREELVDMQFDETVEKASAKPPLQLRDAELLLSYLTVPYLRIPLLLTFFADQQRLTALSSIRMQQARSLVHILTLPVLESALFEPGCWQPFEQRPVPSEVPVDRSERRKVLSTPLGLLFNELLLSPRLVLEPLHRLLAATLEMDTGAVQGAPGSIICFVLRLVVRVESYVCFILKAAAAERESLPSSPPTSLPMEEEASTSPSRCGMVEKATVGEAGGEGDAVTGLGEESGVSESSILFRRTSTPFSARFSQTESKKFRLQTVNDIDLRLPSHPSCTSPSRHLHSDLASLPLHICFIS
ncbi:MAG: hypothetical protein SGPRY_012306, partial [Prymnesium sp.]